MWILYIVLYICINKIVFYYPVAIKVPPTILRGLSYFLALGMVATFMT